MAYKIIKGICIVIIILVVIIGGFFTFVLFGKEKVKKVKIGDINISSTPNGTYTGSFDGYRWTNTVKVTVADHKITDIEVIKPQVFAKAETINELKNKVISSQNLQVDTVTGATVDSKAFLKAIENALKQ